MKKLFALLFITSILSTSFSADHGMYMLTNKNIKGDYSKVCEQVTQAVQSAGFNILAVQGYNNS